MGGQPLLARPSPVAVPRFGDPVFQVRFEREAVDLCEASFYPFRLY